MGGNNFNFHTKTQEIKPSPGDGTGDLAKPMEGFSEAIGSKLWFHCFLRKELSCCCGTSLL